MHDVAHDNCTEQMNFYKSLYTVLFRDDADQLPSIIEFGREDFQINLLLSKFMQCKCLLRPL